MFVLQHTVIAFMHDRFLKKTTRWAMPAFIGKMALFPVVESRPPRGLVDAHHAHSHHPGDEA